MPRREGSRLRWHLNDTEGGSTYRLWIEFSNIISFPILLSVSDALDLADALALKMGKVLTEAASIDKALPMTTDKVITDAASLADTVPTMLIWHVSQSGDALSIADPLPLKTGKVLSQPLG